MSRDTRPALSRVLVRRIVCGLGVVLVALHAAKVVFFSLSGPAPLYRDALYYWQLATEVAAGDGLLLGSAGATRTPGYPWFLSVHAALFGELGTTAAAATQQLLAGASGGLAAWICWRATGSSAGAVLALLLALFSVSRSLIAHYLWSDTLLGLLVTATLAAFVEWWRASRSDSGKRRARVLAGMVGLGLGACALTRPVAQYLIVPVAAAALFHLARVQDRPPQWATARAHGLCLVLAFALLVTPWLVRNQMLFGEPFLVKFSGRTLWLSCFHPRAANLPFVDTPAMNRVLAIADAPGVDRRELWDIYAGLMNTGHSELEADAMMAAATWETIRALPLDFAAATAHQFVEFWIYPYPVMRWRIDDPLIELEGTDLDQRPWRAEWVLPAYQGLLTRVGGPRRSVFATAAVATAIALAALLAQPAYRSLGLALASVLLYFSVVTVVASYPLYRFRSILEPTMIATISLAVASHGWRRQRRSAA